MNSRCVRPLARLSEPRARNRPRSHAHRQWSAAASQSNGGAPPAPARSRGAAFETDRESRHRRLPVPGVVAETGRFGEAVARPRRIDAGELGPERDDEIPFGARHLTPSGWRTG